MKTLALFASLLFSAMSISLVSAQPPHGMEGPPPPHPILEAIDQDRDHEISAEEIDSAAENLRSLDKNSDGVLNEDDLRPMGPPPGGPPRHAYGQGQPQRPRGQGRPSGGGQPGDFTQQLLAFDQDGSGTLEKEELPERMHSLVEQNDTNDDSVLDQEELAAMEGTRSVDSEPNRAHDSGQRNRTRNRQRVRTQGRTPPGSHAERFVTHAMSFDSDGDGCLNEEELTEFAEQLPPRGGPGGRGGDGQRGGSGGRPGGFGGPPPRR